jgi:PEGA domain-containing protein
MLPRLRILGVVCFVGLSSLFIGLPAARPQDKIMGQIQFIDANKVAKTSGVWVDGQYIGYLGELKGSSRLRLLPGEHELLVRQAGYGDFSRKVTIEPGVTLEVHAVMERDPRFQFPEKKTRAEIKLNVWPERAAVFLDGNFVGHVSEFTGLGHGMLVAPGKHTIKVALVGYKSFETELTLLPRQKFALKTDLAAGSINDADALIKSDRPSSLRATSSEADTGGRAK